MKKRGKATGGARVFTGATGWDEPEYAVGDVVHIAIVWSDGTRRGRRNGTIVRKEPFGPAGSYQSGSVFHSGHSGSKPARIVAVGGDTYAQYRYVMLEEEGGE